MPGDNRKDLNSMRSVRARERSPCGCCRQRRVRLPLQLSLRPAQLAEALQCRHALRNGRCWRSSIDWATSAGAAALQPACTIGRPFGAPTGPCRCAGDRSWLLRPPGWSQPPSYAQRKPSRWPLRLALGRTGRRQPCGRSTWLAVQQSFWRCERIAELGKRFWTLHLNLSTRMKFCVFAPPPA